MVRINGHTILKHVDSSGLVDYPVYCLYDKVGILPTFDSLREAIAFVLEICLRNGH